MVPFFGVSLAVQSYKTERRVETNFELENDALTSNSPSTAFKRVSLKWLTPSIFQDPLQVKVSKETKRALELFHRKSAEELEGTLKTKSRYERVFRSLERDGMFVKLSKVPGGGVGPS